MTDIDRNGEAISTHVAPRTTEDLVRGWGMESRYAREMLHCAPLDRTPPLWWEPHLVYVIHLDAENLYKVGLTRHNSPRLKDFGRKAPLVDSVAVANRWTARIVEVEVLRSMVSHRVVATTLGTRHGREECWDDSVPPPKLSDVLAQLEAVLPLPPYWSTSVMTTPPTTAQLSSTPSA